jgi:hypothetical protein
MDARAGETQGPPPGARSRLKPMSSRKFRIGQMVIFRAGVRRRNTTPPGTYQVVRFLPERKVGDPGYQIKHLNEGEEHVARESELRSAAA